LIESYSKLTSSWDRESGSVKATLLNRVR
jgi:hypothetical protein